ncbi:MAG: ATP-binding protein [Verrucomicrobiota bacterium]
MSQKTIKQTETEDLRRALEERTLQVEAVTKELEKFTYSVSHDLRAPLRAIEGFSRILLEDYNDKLDEDGRRYLNIIDCSSRKMTHLLDALLMFSRLGRQELKLTRLNMHELVSSVWDELNSQTAPRKIELKLNKIPDALGDVTLMRHIWENLLGNAIKFTAKKDRAIIEISGKLKRGQVVYCIKDNGVGFNMKAADKLFGVFQRLHSQEEFDGNGMGLALVRRLVRRHSGDIWGEAEVGEGATFCFHLPSLVRPEKN